MGILLTCEQIIRELPLPKNFSVCELGDQWITHCAPHRLARELYEELGCSRYVSLDGNGRGTHTVDLNRKLGEYNLGVFDLVTDFGTGEHVFNQAQVWKSVHELTKRGGYIVWDRPVQGYTDHGFYNTHECLFRDLAAANGYEIVKLLHADAKRGKLIRGVYRKTSDSKFCNPQQGRYHKTLQAIM
jgi:hypothetical protein